MYQEWQLHDLKPSKKKYVEICGRKLLNIITRLLEFEPNVELFQILEAMHKISETKV
tara:strand:+ start:992 stop:1162 length:171 start_codon:yes stop_codon:yes gene_type:complete